MLTQGLLEEARHLLGPVHTVSTEPLFFETTNADFTIVDGSLAFNKSFTAVMNGDSCLNSQPLPTSSMMLEGTIKGISSHPRRGTDFIVYTPTGANITIRVRDCVLEALSPEVPREEE